MYCLKCGRETEEKQVFCPECLAIQANYPVKPNTPVTIHRREAVKNSPVPTQIKPSKKVLALKKTVRRLSAWLAVVTVLLLASLACLGYMVHQSRTQPSIGQNYSTTGASAPSTAPAGD